MIKFAEADLLFYIGLGLESFIKHAQETLKNKNVEFVATTANVPKEKFNMSTGHSHEEHSEEGEVVHTEEHTHKEETRETKEEHS